MVGVVIVAHGCFASALLTTAEEIAGKQEQVISLNFTTGENTADLQLRIKEAARSVDTGQGTIIFVDLLGGSPYQAAAIVAMQQSGIEMVAGVNMPMLLEILPVRNDKLMNVTNAALKGGHDGIRNFDIMK
ncbi:MULTISPECIES: PTS sugar transporter subunit IIA [Pelosinus]|jgi:PTS system mannose-specific IIA component|uniref:PTS system, mannose/fructose/sorbose family, IIA subunit n=1 Tax=Pelosinus fermentans B4 TaxID=1149862 RepID=I9LEZ6_9FIRM|nr:MULTISPECIES: PTS sugar transporter subunit IIA [Pelosinus]EIW19044.1 PTS system, mannose/fructose/sorbose family, IIA subunit [Pelosinus fermentans B4]EIW21746.1 PTS system, mannose/fructose/sorbose family, IIA subunit [Pelosinus fermentans A11]OAM95406.1 PTS system, mannose/fructose/sorbose family, IIA subunit [Pelosinus fermentans DSM 17108]SDR27639.1 PTS system D-mannose-specific IIA component, Man family [Pelosinus fermentans]